MDFLKSLQQQIRAQPYVMFLDSHKPTTTLLVMVFGVHEVRIRLHKTS